MIKSVLPDDVVTRYLEIILFPTLGSLMKGWGTGICAAIAAGACYGNVTLFSCLDTEGASSAFCASVSELKLNAAVSDKVIVGHPLVSVGTIFEDRSYL